VSAVALKHCEKYPMHVYEVRPRKDHRGFDLISDAVRFGRLWYNGRKPCFGDLTASMKKPRLFISHSWKDKFL
jgi:hypothetical protein